MLLDIPNSVSKKNSRYLRSINDPVRVMAATWSMDYYIPLVFYGAGKNINLIKYENILRERVNNSFEKLLSSSNRKFKKPSQSSTDDTIVDDAERQIAKWKYNLGSEEKEKIREVVSHFGLFEKTGYCPHK
jgi:hypothetical protein